MEKKCFFFFFFFFSNWEFFAWNWEKNILFGIGNGAEFRPQNRVIESPESIVPLKSQAINFDRSCDTLAGPCEQYSHFQMNK